MFLLAKEDIRHGIVGDEPASAYHMLGVVVVNRTIITNGVVKTTNFIVHHYTVIEIPQ